MANEATLVREVGIPGSYTCADGTGIEKGAILKLTTPNTASLSDGDNDIISGICAGEKIANNGVTSVSVYDRSCNGSIFRVTCSGSLSAGDPVVTNASSGGSNTVAVAATNEENILGIMKEDATDGQNKLMELQIATMQLA